ncbi:hypothetical protein H4R18_002490 [Coemansia javaensis]|uniref:RING-type domain-containing protein n=1 Tax=Coemansia javaensis TaxID=2761396 RepID=A0A9W8LJT4_9FUNG|nr:hypothetical protein H4R18_002490 [Coemansia javaensis]
MTGAASDAKDPEPRSSRDSPGHVALDCASAEPPAQAQRPESFALQVAEDDGNGAGQRTGPWQAARTAFQGLDWTIVAGIVVLARSRHEQPVRPLRLFAILHVVRLFVYYPLYVRRMLWPSAEPSAIRLLRHTLELCSLVLFVCGNSWVFSGESDRLRAPHLYHLSRAYIFLGYAYVAIPLLLAIGTLLLFAAVYAISPEFRMRLSKKKGADLSQISRIPLVRYTAAPALAAPHSSPPSLHGARRSAAQSVASLCAPPPPPAAQSAVSLGQDAADRRQQQQQQQQQQQGRRSRRHGLSQAHALRPFVRIAHRMTRSKRQRAAEAEMYRTQLAGPVPDFTPRDPEDGACAICLCDYEEGDVLRLLPCSHHMHQACVDEWLHISQACPLCKQSATGAPPPPPLPAPGDAAPAHGCVEFPAAPAPVATTATTTTVLTIH